MTNINDTDPVPTAGPAVKCGCGFTITGHLPEDAQRILAKHDCPASRQRDLGGLWLVLMVAVVCATIVAVRIWGH